MKTIRKDPKDNKPSSKRLALSRKSIPKDLNAQHNQAQRFAGERRVVLFDLDGTLMDSGTAWRECSQRAIAQLKKILPPNLEESSALAAYRAIYECHADIKGRIGPRGHTFEDMRQEWNTRSSYALLLAWSKFGEFLSSRGTARNVSYYQAALRDLLSDERQSARLFDDAEEFRDTWYIEYAPYIDCAWEEFWNEDFRRYLYPGVPELLYNLRLNHIEYYVATEGHLPTQWRKIRALGLDQPNDPKDPESLPWISPKQLLVTSQAARPHRALQALVGLSEWYRGREAASREALNLFPASDHQRSQLQLTAQSSEIMADGLARMAGFFRRLASKISRDNSGHVQPEFYTRVLYAINQAPDNPRDQFAKTDFTNWDPTPCIHLAMVGDKHSSDIAPVLQLAHELGTKIMSIWVRQGSHGAGEPEPETRREWVECNTIAEAGEKYLLNNQAWLELTKCIVKPARLFFSAIEPPRGSKEKLEENIQELLAGVGAVRSNLSQTQQNGPNQSMIKTAAGVVSDLLGIIVSDIRLSKVREEVVDVLLSLCSNPDLRSKEVRLGQCAGLPEATVELLLAITEERKGDTNTIGSYRQCLEVMANLIEIDQIDWAAAVIKVLYEKSEVVDHQICPSEELSKRYRDQLIPLRRSLHLPNDFPTREADWLYGRILRCLDRATHNSQSPLPSTTREEVILGQSTKKQKYQQYISLGVDREGREVYCSLGGPKMRNIVCICGSPGTGKSSSLDALVLGALQGESLESARVSQSSVIVFHHELAGACPFVIPAQRLGLTTKIFAFENELSNIKNEYSGLPADQVNPLRFQLDQLSDELVLRWVGIRDSTAAAQEFHQVRWSSGLKNSLSELRNAFETASPRVTRQKNQILRALKKLEPIIAKREELSFSKEIEPGRLIIIDCGRVNRSVGRLDTWEIVLSILEKQWDSRKENEHMVLVFDELHQVFGRNSNLEAKQLASRLGGLVDRMGRHQQVSIVAASQRPNDFKGTGDLWEAATVLLIHRLQTPIRDVPNGELWEVAKNVGDFSNLRVGEAWYCSREQNDRELNHKLTGYVQVRLRT